MLLAVNRRYPLGYKFLDSIFERCVLAPDRFAERFESAPERPPERAAKELRALVHEPMTWLGSTCPGLDPGQVEQWRIWFAYDTPALGP